MRVRDEDILEGRYDPSGSEAFAAMGTILWSLLLMVIRLVVFIYQVLDALVRWLIGKPRRITGRHRARRSDHDEPDVWRAGY